MTLGGIRRRPTLPGRFQPSTISVLRLNFCVRDGNRWIPQAIVTGNLRCRRPSLPPFRYRRFGRPGLASSLLRRRFGLRYLCTFVLAPSKPHRDGLPFAPDHGPPFALLKRRFRLSGFRALSNQSSQDQALDRLVSPSSIRYRTSTDDLSTRSSSGGLTPFGWESYS